MKKTLFALGISALLLVAPRVVNADVSVDFFYNNLPGGSWVEVGDYGYCWQPDVAVGNTGWRPYSDGYWAYTDLGWTWVSYEDFGWATYHYGRWALISDYGWVWVPGRDADLEWGPAWVSWRTGGDYIGWAPLPPETITVVESRPLTGHLDIEFNIGPVWYNFVETRYIGEPVLRERIIAPTQNVTYIQQTVNVTNITYNNRTVYNYGPDINVINRTAARPIQRLRLDREQNVDVTAAAKSGGLTRVQGDRLVVAAPMRFTRSARQAAPQNIKPKVAAAKIDRGWSVAGDDKAQAELKNRIKTQNSKNIPPPANAGGGAAQAGTAASASPAGNVGADSAGSPQSQGQERDGRGKRAAAAMAATSPNQGVSPAPNASPAQAGSNENTAGRGRGQGRAGTRFPPHTNEQPSPAGGSSAADAAGAAQDENQGGGRRGQHPGQQNPNQPTSASGMGAEGPNTAAEQSQRGGRGTVRQGRGPVQNPSGQGAGPATQEMTNQGQVRDGDRRFQRQAPETPQGQSPQGQGQGQGQGHHGGQHGQAEGSPAPSPQ